MAQKTVEKRIVINYFVIYVPSKQESTQGPDILLPLYPTYLKRIFLVPVLTVNARISDMARISAIFGLFYVLWRYFELRHYFNDVKVPKNSQDQCEFEYLFIF